MAPKTVVSPEDQQKINKFARLYDRERQLKAEIATLKKTILNLEDAELGIMEVEGDQIPIRYGSCFITEKSDYVSTLIEKKQSEAKTKQSEIEDSLGETRSEMAALRTELYATFGDNISLEADEEQ